MIIGLSSVGKTMFARTYAKMHNLKALRVNDIQDFRRLEKSYKMILLDDANFDKLSPTEILSVVDNSCNKTIRVLYGTVLKPKHIIQMITMNLQEFSRQYNTLKDDRIAQQICFVRVKKIFIKNINHNFFFQKK